MVSNLFNFYKNSAVAKDKKKIYNALKKNRNSNDKASYDCTDQTI